MDLFEFIEIIKQIPKPNEVDELCKNNIYYPVIEKLVSIEYFKLSHQD